MAARPHVPQFGKWENEEYVPYTLYFDNARKGRGGKMINPNDPQENPDIFPDFAPSAPAPAPRPPSRTRAQAEGRPARQSAGSEHSFERPPLHSHHQAKVTGRGGTSPAGDGKNSYDSSHGAPGKSRTKPVTRADESIDRDAAVPRFGDWNENNPQSADNYTHIFNNFLEERHSSPSDVSGNKYETYRMTQKQNDSGKRKGCCFPWLGK